MSLGLCYNGRRKVVAVNPTTKLMSVLEEGCEYFKLDATCCRLKKGKVVVDLTIPFRFSNLQPNSSIDIEVTSATTPAASSRAASTKLAFSIEGGESISAETFPATFTLIQVLQQLVDQGKLSACVTNSSSGSEQGQVGECQLESNPEVIYLQSAYRGQQLVNTTLANLGLAGQAARVQVRYTGAGTSTSTGTPSKEIVESKESLSVFMPKVASASVRGPMETTSSPSSSPHSKSTCNGNDNGNVNGIGDSNSSSNGSGSNSPHRTVPAPNPSPVSTMPLHAHTHTQSLPESQPLQVQSPAELMQSLLQDHFDAVSKPAVLTLARYIFNIWAAPLDPKYRVLYVDNRIFVDKVASCQGALRFLAGVGFLECVINSRRALHLAVHTQCTSTSACATGIKSQREAEWERMNAEETTEALRFEPAVRAIEQALEELSIPREERPVAANRSLLALQRQRHADGGGTVDNSISTVPLAVPFNPYKTYVRRVADVNPDGSIRTSATLGSGNSGRSITEIRLIALATRRRELEGDPEDALTEPTELLCDTNTVDIASAKSSNNVDDDREYAAALASEEEEDQNGRQPGDSRLLAASLKDKIQNPSEDAPLTTAALRALKKAQKEMVYTRSLIRIRLPNRTVLQRRFHPRNTIHDIYKWVSSCSVCDADFDLYITPPRQVLNKADTVTTLMDMHFVPAAILNISWIGGSSSGSGLLPELIASAKACGELAIPTGQSLVEVEASAAGTSANFSAGGAKSSSSNSSSSSTLAESKDSGAGKKRPAWFKL